MTQKIQIDLGTGERKKSDDRSNDAEDINLI